MSVILLGVILALSLASEAPASAGEATTVLIGLDMSKVAVLWAGESLDFYNPLGDEKVYDFVPRGSGHQLYVAVQPHTGVLCGRISFSNLAAATFETHLEDFGCSADTPVKGTLVPVILTTPWSETLSEADAKMFLQVSAEMPNTTFDISYAYQDPGIYDNTVSVNHIWWTKSGQYVAVDRVLLIVMICMAIFFELAHVLVHNCIKKHSVAHFNMKLWNRVNSEFMVLGFIAFLLWVTERAGGVASLVSHLPLHMNAADMLHMIEDVHMRLFITMTLYYLVMVWVVLNATWYMRKWARTEEEIRFGGVCEFTERVPRQFATLRGKFLRHIAHDDPVIDPIRHETLTEEQLQNFNYAAYVNKTLEHMMMEMVAIRAVSWLGTAVVTTCIVLFVYYTPIISDYGVFWVMLGIELTILAMLVAFAIYVECAYRKAVGPGPFLSQNCCTRHMNDLAVARFVQIAVFYGCYTLIYFATSVDARQFFQDQAVLTYHSDLDAQKATLGPFLAVFLPTFLVVNIIVVPLMLPRINVVFRNPPFLDSREKRQVARIIYGRYHTAFFPRTFPVKKHKDKSVRGRANTELYANRKKRKHRMRKVFQSSSASYSADESSGGEAHPHEHHHNNQHHHPKKDTHGPMYEDFDGAPAVALQHLATEGAA